MPPIIGNNYPAAPVVSPVVSWDYILLVEKSKVFFAICAP